MLIKRGDIFYADLSPIIGSEQDGIRPVLVIQNDTGNKYSTYRYNGTHILQKEKQPSGEFAGGVYGTVNAETAEFTEIIPEEEIIQSNAELLSDIYSDESMSSDLLTEISDTVLIDSSSAVSAAKETEETADQTDIQVIILTENMSAFGRSKS